MRCAALCLLVFALQTQGAHAQSRNTNEQPDCPVVRVSCPDIARGPTTIFSASVSGVNLPAELKFNWEVSAGVITGGQGTRSITVDTSAIGGRSVTATVDVGGLPERCRISASCSTSPICIVLSRKVGEYDNISIGEEKARLDNFAIELGNNPTAQGYLLAYAGRHARVGEATVRAERAKDYLVNNRGIDGSRVVALDGGHREELTIELYIVPTGAVPPPAAPTVDPSEVQIIGGKSKRRRARIKP